MTNPATLAAAGLLALAAVLPFARVDGPVVIPLTVAIAGAVAIVFAHVYPRPPRPRHQGDGDPPEPAPEEDGPLRLHRAA